MTRALKGVSRAMSEASGASSRRVALSRMASSRANGRSDVVDKGCRSSALEGVDGQGAIVAGEARKAGDDIEIRVEQAARQHGGAAAGDRAGEGQVAGGVG